MNFPGSRHPGAAALCVLLHAAMLLAFLQQKPRGHAAQQEAATAIMLMLPAMTRPAPALPRPIEASSAKPPPAPTPAASSALPPAPPAPASIAEPAIPAAQTAQTNQGVLPAAAADAAPPTAVVAPAAMPEPGAVHIARPDHAHSPQPEYPMALRELGVQGTVLLRVWVEPDGRPGDIRLARSSGQRLFDDAALRAVRNWRFLPARAGEQAIASWVEFPIRFNLI